MPGTFHALTDRAASAAGLFMRDRSKFFAESIDSPPLAQLVERLEVPTPPVDQVGVHELPTDSPWAALDPACWVASWVGPNRPMLILHHGNNERAFDMRRSAKNFLTKAILQPDPPDANVVVIRAAFHAGSLRDYTRQVRSLPRFAAMLAASTLVIEQVLRAARKAGCPRVVVAGLSLGGWATNLHRTYLGTADTYLPLLAGADLGEVFATSGYRCFTSRVGHEHADQLRAVLNFGHDFAEVHTDNVYPLLARYDQYVEYERQIGAYRNRNVTVLDKGHATACLDSTALRTHVLRHLTSGDSRPVDGLSTSTTTRAASSPHRDG